MKEEYKGYGLFDRNAFCKVSWHINVIAKSDGYLH